MDASQTTAPDDRRRPLGNGACFLYNRDEVVLLDLVKSRTAAARAQSRPVIWRARRLPCCSSGFRSGTGIRIEPPSSFFLTEDRLLISCNFHFSDKALCLRPDGCDQTYAELITEGIRMFWSGEYLLPLPEKLQPVTVEVLITSKPQHRAVPIRLRHMLFMPAHVRSPWYRHFWGLIRTGQIESIGTNWSREQPGAMILPYLQDPEQVRRIAAHEAGHLFGLGDAYGAIYRFYDAAPGTEWFMMNGNWAVQSTEILMMLRAHMTNRMQFFPRHFQWTRFRAGFIADIRLRLADAERRIEAYSQERRARNPALQPAPTAAEEPTIMIERRHRENRR